MSAAAPARGGSLAAKAAAAAGLVALLGVAALVMLVGAISRPPTRDAGVVAGASAFALSDIPAGYLADYQQAASTSGLDWAVLAGIGKVETDHGRLRAAGVTAGANFLGCCGGPMQFFYVPYPGRIPAATKNPSTWGQYGVDGNGDGVKDVWDPADAIPAAANYLKASGAPGDYRAAVWAYNHSDAYYQDVMRWADRYRAAAPGPLALGAGGGDKVAQLIAAATALQALRVPYCYGGGHLTPARPTTGSYCWGGSPIRQIYGSRDAGLDCSSSVSLLLQQIGYQLPTMTSGSFTTWGLPGPGAAVTIWANTEHVYLQINTGGRDLYFGTSAENYRHGPGWHTPRSGTGFIARHPQGL